MTTRDSAVRAPSPIRQRPWSKAPARVVRFMRTKPLGATGLLILVVASVIAIAGPFIVPRDPLRNDVTAILQAPNSAHWFGTDILGRDILSRTISGARLSMYVGFVAMLLSASVGSIIGITSAYFGGWYDLIAQRFIDALIAFPSLLLAIALLAAFGQSVTNIILAIAITFMPRFARVLRSVTLSIKQNPYIDAARSMGATESRIMLLHIAPNTFASMAVVASASVGAMIIVESSLSFLGLGTPANVVSWGGMLSGQTLTYFAGAPWIGIFPGLALTLVVFGINTVGDALRDVLDPRMRGQ